MEKNMNVLMVEDNEDDALLLERRLRKGGYHARYRRVEIKSDLERALGEQSWDLILCDYKLPSFRGTAALQMVKERELDVPFIFVSGTMGEDTAVEAMTLGAHDYVMKNNLTRLLPAIERELKEVEVRRERRRAEEALRESEKKYRDLVDNALVGVYRTNMEGEILYVNRALWKMLEFESAEDMMSEKALKRYKNPAERERLLGMLQGNGTIDGFETDMVTKTGRTRNVILSATLGGDFLSGMILDITERKRAEENLHLQAAALESAANSIILTDSEGSIRWVNPAFTKMTGYSSGEVLGQNPSILKSGLQDRSFYEQLWTTILSGRVWQGQVTNRRKNGELYVEEMTITPVHDGGGRITNFIAIKQDITERKRAEEALRESESRYRALVETSPDAITLTGLDGQILVTNQQAAQMHGCAAIEELIGKNAFDLIAPEDRQRAMEDAQKSLLQGGVRNVEYSFLRMDGTRFFGELSASLLVDSDGKPTAFIRSIRDITERKRTQEQLVFQSSFLDKVRSAAIATDLDGNIIYWNTFAEMLLGWKAEEVLGKQANEIVVPPAGRSRTVELRKHIDRTGHWEGEMEYRRKDGSLVPVYVTSALLKNSAGEAIGRIGVSSDISERKRAEKALHQSEERFRSLFENSIIGIYRTTPDGEIVLANPAFVRMLGYSSAAEVTERNPELDGIELSYSRSEFRQRIEKEGEIKGLESAWKRRDGSTIFVRESARAVRGPDGKVLYYEGTAEDITERKRAEAALRDSEARYRMLFEASADGILIADVETKTFKYANPAVCRMLGYTEEELGTLGLADIHPKQDLQWVFAEFEAQARGDKTLALDIPCLRKDGRILYADINTAKFTIDGRPYNVGLFRDITERKLAQQRLEDERYLLRTIIEAIPDEIAVKDIERRFVLVNPACVQAFKKESAEEVVGKRDEDMIPEENASDGMLEDERILATGEPFVNKEGKTRINPKTGAIERSILISKIPLRDRDGKITGLVAVNRDITKRKIAEVEVQRSRDWLNAILDASRDGIVAEKNEMIVYANAPYAHIYGYDEPAELTGQHVSLVQSELDNTRMLQFGRRRLDGERMPEVYEFKGRKKDGRFIDLEASVSTASIAGEEHIVATIRDITERKSLQKQLIEAQKMESIGTLAGGIAHDFNNILGIIMGHASILEQMRPSPEKFLQSIQAISKATYRGASLVRQLLTFARKTDVTMQSVLINDILNELAKLLEDTLPKTIVMELNLEKKLPSILADPTQLHQVFLNLCVNARDAIMPKGGSISIASRLVRGESVSAKFDRADTMEYIVIDVADTGTGMDEATRRRIFEPFFTTKEKGKGTGLGLATVYGIVESHRGFIDVESRLGVGSTFHVYLPVEPRHVTRDEPTMAAEKEVPGGTETILVVEDEETLRDLVSFVLEGKGYRVLKASDGEEGLRLFTERMQDIALVLSDLGLPKISGEDLFRRMRQLKPEAKVILATGYIEPGMKSELLKAGARELIQKPYVPADVLKKIREVLDSAV
jgi:PAS domain S-box-containing protein